VTWRLLATAVISALLTGVMGFVWWGLPLQRLRADVDSLFQKGSVTKALCAEFRPGVTSIVRPPGDRSAGRAPDGTLLGEPRK
jgi:hypothetical protein